MAAEYPHLYKEQRRLEKAALKERNAKLDRGIKVPPMCGYRYVPRKPKNPDVAWSPNDVLCARVAGAGTDHHGKGFCDYHEVQANAELESVTAPKQVQAAKRYAYEQAKFFGQPVNVDPYTAIMQEIARTSSVVAWVEEKFAAERAAGMSDREIMQQSTLKDGFKISVWMEMYQAERKHLINTCMSAVKAGIAERKVQIAEQQGRLIVAMMMAFIHDPELGLSPDQVYRAPALIRKHLMNLPNENQDAVEPKAILEAHSVEL